MLRALFCFIHDPAPCLLGTFISAGVPKKQPKEPDGQKFRQSFRGSDADVGVLAFLLFFPCWVEVL